MKNRYGVEYEFVALNDNTYTIKGDLEHWRFGGREGVEGLDTTNLGFVDPSGGPYIAVNSTIAGRTIKQISLVDGNIHFIMEDK